MWLELNGADKIGEFHVAIECTDVLQQLLMDTAFEIIFWLIAKHFDMIDDRFVARRIGTTGTMDLHDECQKCPVSASSPHQLMQSTAIGFQNCAIKEVSSKVSNLRLRI